SLETIYTIDSSSRLLQSTALNLSVVLIVPKLSTENAPIDSIAQEKTIDTIDSFEKVDTIDCFRRQLRKPDTIDLALIVSIVFSPAILSIGFFKWIVLKLSIVPDDCFSR
ncbi:hypothetical protein AVEN_181981-1, partial [Araneus ventricosus]